MSQDAEIRMGTPWPGPGIVATIVLALFLSGCTLFGGLSEDEELKLGLYVQQAKAFMASSRYTSAQQQAEKALSIDPDHFTANLILGWSLLQQRNPGKLVQARKVFNKLLDDGSVDFRTHLGLGLVRYQQGLSELARSDQLERWMTNRPAREIAARESGISVPNDEELQILITRAKASSKEALDAAVTELQTVLELNDRYPQALLTLGQINLLRKEDDKALKHFESYIELAEKTRSVTLDEDAWLSGSLTKPEEDLVRSTLEQKVRSNVNKEVTVRLAVAFIYFRNQDYPAALSHLDRAIELDPETILAYLNRGECHGKLGNYAEAVKDLQTFVKKSDRDFDEVMQRATTLLDEYTRALARNPSLRPTTHAERDGSP